ncbi:hypothetical protein Moror_8857 [Moniliophthora roreri MCA 2997]|uniref:Uncharacterized protein n=2 Tax=Moniliophthora roreri TaxID=221103 RepID=V2YN90_MONRO|nr:hypothetical protein Moror_8857 [Moniliophthora roreri MCA 2997]KAI3604440.1 hypothetical protein WG66_008543 [Moniliophthora roreri]
MPHSTNTTCSICGSAVQAPSSSPSPSMEAENLLKTNETPYNREACCASLADAEAYLGNLNAKIDRIEETLRLLWDEQKRCEYTVQTYKMILHPVRTLPDDVLWEIFAQCLDLNGFGKRLWGMECHPDTLNPRTAPWTLGQVCHRWRTVALSSASLWRHIGIVFPPPTVSDRYLAGMVALLMEQIRRSGVHPLVMYLHAPHNLDTHHPLLTLACAQSTRWEKLRFSVRGAALGLKVLRCISSLVKGTCHLLRCLLLEIMGIDADMFGTELIDAFSFAPRLHELSFFGPPAIFPLINIPRHQLTHYRDQTDFPSANEQVIRQMVNLMGLYALGLDLSQFASTSMVHLRTLSLHFPSRLEKSTDSFLLQSLPNLRDFRLAVVWLNERKLGLLQSFLTRCAPTLRSIYISVFNDRDNHLIKLLECVPGLTCLRLCNVNTAAIRALAVPTFLAHLRDIGFWALRQEDIEPLVRLVENRVTCQEPQLKMMRLGINGTDFSQLQQLKALEAKGIQIEISLADWFRDVLPDIS